MSHSFPTNSDLRDIMDDALNTEISPAAASAGERVAFNSAAPFRILLVDDSPVWRSSIRSLVEGDPQFAVCGEAGTVAEAIQAAAALQPDIAIIDLALGSGNGFQVIAGIGRQAKDVRLVVLSMHSEATYGERALRSGALAYVMKQDALEDLPRALRRVADGRRWLTDALAHGLHVEQNC
ncbi:MAG TPA: response regulator transcription factor [Candidatus Didemnitutus sp.]|jgi:DNA-binding NarL/FixJ family response regulator